MLLPDESGGEREAMRKRRARTAADSASRLRALRGVKVNAGAAKTQKRGSASGRGGGKRVRKGKRVSAADTASQTGRRKEKHAAVAAASAKPSGADKQGARRSFGAGVATSARHGERSAVAGQRLRNQEEGSPAMRR